jgi:hypothetical protein
MFDDYTVPTSLALRCPLFGGLPHHIDEHLEQQLQAAFRSFILLQFS